MPIEFLTHEQICELTGVRTRKGQIGNLAKNRIRHSIKVNGWPSVTVAAVEGYKPAAGEEPPQPAWVLDLSKVR